METKPDTIKISASHKEEIFAMRADLYVTVKGASLVSGAEAMKKAKEVSQLVEAVTSFGLSPEAVMLQGVRIETASGTLLKSSSAAYRLKIRCQDLGQFAGLVDVIAAQKNASLDRVVWKYDEDEARERMLTLVIEKAKTKAENVAASLGVKLLGVYDFIENIFDEEMPAMYAPQALMKRSVSAAAEPNLGIEIQHNKNIHVSVDVWYRVSSF
ncbi:MAG: DUF541 domain-containing protein [Chloroflexi bacterium]|nr:DUF541 domain-containing protein [Chloroflexota bacterium]